MFTLYVGGLLFAILYVRVRMVMNIYSYECGSRLCVPLPWPNPASFVKTRFIDIMTGCRANVGHRRHIDGGS